MKPITQPNPKLGDNPQATPLRRPHRRHGTGLGSCTLCAFFLLAGFALVPRAATAGNMIETYTWHETPGDGETVVGHMNVAWPAIQKGSIGLTDVTWFSFSISDKNGSWTFGTAFLTT